jgi:hypothetical protein
VEIEYQSSSVYLLIGTFAGVALVLIVEIELDMFAQATRAAVQPSWPLRRLLQQSRG